MEKGIAPPISRYQPGIFAISLIAPAQMSFAICHTLRHLICEFFGLMIPETCLRINGQKLDNIINSLQTLRYYRKYPYALDRNGTRTYQRTFSIPAISMDDQNIENGGKTARHRCSKAPLRIHRHCSPGFDSIGRGREFAAGSR